MILTEQMVSESLKEKKQILESAGFSLRLYNHQIAINQLRQESSFNTRAENKKSGAKGLAQFLDSTFNEVKNYLYARGIIIKDSYDGNDAIFAYLVYMFVMIPNYLKNLGKNVSIENMLRAYNAGIGRIEQSYNFDETNNYVAVITGNNNNNRINGIASLTALFILMGFMK